MTIYLYMHSRRTPVLCVCPLPFSLAFSYFLSYFETFRDENVHSSKFSLSVLWSFLLQRAYPMMKARTLPRLIHESTGRHANVALLVGLFVPSEARPFLSSRAAPVKLIFCIFNIPFTWNMLMMMSGELVCLFVKWEKKKWIVSVFIRDESRKQ